MMKAWSQSSTNVRWWNHSSSTAYSSVIHVAKCHIQYVPYNIHTALLCFALWYMWWCIYTHMIYLLKLFSYCPGASKIPILLWFYVKQFYFISNSVLWSRQITSLHVSRQPSCHGMCKILRRFHHYFQVKHHIYLQHSDEAFISSLK